MTVKKTTFTRNIKAYGNGAMVPIHKSDIDDLGARIGSKVTVTIQTVDDHYEKTRASAKKMRRRYSRTLDLLGQ
tara:strand:+ start:484 stop:705 length:222 start_codon:yes stop_codon:yes gene_type:complete